MQHSKEALRDSRSQQGFGKTIIKQANTTTTPKQRKSQLRSAPATLPFGNPKSDKQSERITNRPFISLPKKLCPTCRHDYVEPWAFLTAFLPHLRIVDLCAKCARVLRYAEGQHCEEIASEMLLRAFGQTAFQALRREEAA
ncbi:MAG TPA: hypothetical protein VEF04_01665 [Blastocatellia bacterium]|nr:hypothetical protein [Blastocatellia bacterium]